MILYQYAPITKIITGDFMSGWWFRDILAPKVNFGLGTFTHLDGELVLVDGHAWQCTKKYGVQPVTLTSKTPFASVCDFIPTHNWDVQGLDTAGIALFLSKQKLPTDYIWAIKITGVFKSIHLRVVTKQSKSVSLNQAEQNQYEMKLDASTGTLVGFWAPTFMSQIIATGFHFHYINQTKTQGGHALFYQIDQAQISWGKITKVHLTL